MHLGRVDEALAFVRQIRTQLNAIDGVDKVLCPPFTVLAAVADAIRPTRIGLGAQTMHWKDHGAYTGEISPAMLAQVCQYVILGHSERRTGRVVLPELVDGADQPKGTETYFEGDIAINYKVHAALNHSLAPIICVGENLAQNEAGDTHAYVSAQVRAALSGLTPSQARACIFAYEPLWAIGTGKAATPVDANRVIGVTIRGAIGDLFGETTARQVRVQYGGSVNADNITAFITMPEVDGALVGGASLGLDFVQLVQKAASAA
jgi:triosephosphate isomerase